MLIGQVPGQSKSTMFLQISLTITLETKTEETSTRPYRMMSLRRKSLVEKRSLILFSQILIISQTLQCSARLFFASVRRGIRFPGESFPHLSFDFHPSDMYTLGIRLLRMRRRPFLEVLRDIDGIVRLHTDPHILGIQSIYDYDIR
jgi:hypothetical protein